MPKSKKPAGGRPAKNFEPRYGEKKTPFHERSRGAAGAKPGSKSPSHRGYRPAEDGSGPAGAAKTGAPKTRWTATQRAGRDEARGIRTHAQSDRPARSYDDRPARGAYQTPGRSGDPPRSYDDRPARRDSDRAFGSDSADRPARREYTNDRPARSYDDRPARSYDDRPARSYDDRPARSNDRPARSYDDRPARSAMTVRRVRTDRPARSYDDRPARSNGPSGSFVRRPPGALAMTVRRVRTIVRPVRMTIARRVRTTARRVRTTTARLAASTATIARSARTTTAPAAPAPPVAPTGTPRPLARRLTSSTSTSCTSVCRPRPFRRRMSTA